MFYDDCEDKEIIGFWREGVLGRYVCVCFLKFIGEDEFFEVFVYCVVLK